MTVENLINYDELYEYLLTNITRTNYLLDIINEINKPIYNEEKTLLKEKAFLVYNEEIPITFSGNKPKITTDYLLGKIKFKEDFLRNRIVKIYIGNKNTLSKYVCYNRNELTSIIKDEEKIFLKGSDDVSLFLSINDEPAGVFYSKNISYYSALLNFNAEEIGNTSGYSEEFKPDITDWDKKREVFLNFLDTLKSRTINYNKEE